MTQKRLSIVGSTTFLAVSTLANANLLGDGNYQAYYLFLGDDPSSLQSSWSHEAQGLAHDDTHWYITQRDAIWRVPVSANLSSFDINTPGVSRLRLGDVPALIADGYNHFGDPCVWHFGVDYLLVPIEGGPAGLAVLLADSLDYVDHTGYPQEVQTHSSWVGVDEVGSVYSSMYDPVNSLLKYTVNWNQVSQEQTLSPLFAESITLRPEDGVSMATLRHVQGGEFTPDGQWMYIVADGIHVFDVSTWRRVQQSSNGVGPFNYEFHGGFPEYEEPEGPTIWDLEGTPSPHRGELHVILLDNDNETLGDDDVYLKHYTRTIWVDATNAGPQYGTPDFPFRTISSALNFAWDGAELRIQAGAYGDMVTIDKRILLSSENGRVRIGD